MSLQLPITIKSTGSFESYLTYVNSLPMLNEAQEKALFLAYQDDDNLEAAQQIILSHLRFVAYIARSYKGYGLPIEDLVQEGTIGLMKSVKKFNLEFGVRLASFAVHYIKSEIQEFVIRNWRIVKSATTKAKRKLFYNLKRLKSSTGWLTDQERMAIENQLEVSPQDLNEMELQLSQPDILISSVEKTDKEDVNSTLEHILEDKSESIENTLLQEDLKRKVLCNMSATVDTLDERSKDIIISRWLSPERKTHKVLSQKYGVSQERIRQIEEKALIKIKQSLHVFNT